MVKNQPPMVDVVGKHLEDQKNHPYKAIIVISVEPGTGKTIVGMHFIYDYSRIFETPEAYGTVFGLPRSKTVKSMIDYECGQSVVSFLDNIARNQKMVVVDEAHRIDP